MEALISRYDLKIGISDDIFSTLNVYWTGYLSMMGYTPSLVLQSSGKVAFRFANSEELQEHLDDFRAGAMVDVSAFTEIVKDLKRRMYALKEDEKPYGNFFRE